MAGLLTLLGLAPLVHARVFGAGNDASRFATIESLVDAGTGAIDGSRYRWTVDQVSIDGKIYSNKPPLLSLIGAGLYALLQRSLGISFATDEPAAIWFLTLILAALPTAALAAIFHRETTRWWGAGPRALDGTTIALLTAATGFGTILASFSTTLNNHTPAAALVFGGCAAAWTGAGGLAGAALGLATGIDIVPGLLFAAALLPVVRDTAGRRGLLRYAAALGLGALLFVAADLAVVGSPWPPKMVPGAVDASSSMGPSIAGVLLPESWTYPFSALFGWHGFFTVSPVLLFGVAGMVGACRSGASAFPRRWSRALAAACAVMIVAHALFVGSYGGWSYGFRYLVPIVPVLLFFAAGALQGRARSLLGPVLALSCVTALLGAFHPWPPGDEPGTGRHPVASLVTNPVGANLAAWLVQYAPGVAEPVAARFIAADPRSRARYLALFHSSRGDWALARRFTALAEGAAGPEASRDSGVPGSPDGRSRQPAETGRR